LRLPLNAAEVPGEGGAATARRRLGARDSDFDLFPGSASGRGLGAADFCALGGLGCICVWALAVSVCTTTVSDMVATAPGFSSLDGWFSAGRRATRSVPAPSGLTPPCFAPGL